MDTASLDDLFGRLGTPRRMRSLAGYNLFAPQLAAELDPVCARSAQRLGAPVSLISIILDSAQYIIGSTGLEGWINQVQGMPAEWSVCTHTVLAGAPYCVADATTDVRHERNPLIGMTGLRSYAGVPLQGDDGEYLGAHCVLDTAARTFGENDLEVLRDGAAEAMRVLRERS
ncbi:GAF domain-containing protein [Actinoplanes sp. NPDC048796]|uniref:GAF domain-containing protein n=1 Tax=unclassified Actinoplanes TaxID=2626549 RepID=UPI0033F5C6A4